MNYNNPLISIIITSFNCELNIENTINSAINQSYKNKEIIIIDDNSSDRTFEICNKFRDLSFIKIIKNSFVDKKRDYNGVNINAGYSSRNLGIKYAKGDWISFIDGGDFIHPSKIELQLKVAQKYKILHLVSDYCTFDRREVFFKKSIPIDFNINNIKILSTEDLIKVLNRQKDLFARLPSLIRRKIPLKIRQSYKLRRIMYPLPMEPFPGCGPSVFFHKSIKTRYKFLQDRRWASAKGRGADRDFNFNVLEKYRSSVMMEIPLYYWGI